MDEFIKWMLENIDGEDILKIIKKYNIQIRGFSKIQLIANRFNAPKKVIINQIVNENKEKNFLQKFFQENIENKKFSEYQEKDFIKEKYKKEDIMIILKYLYSQREKEVILKKIIKKIDLSKNIDGQDFVEIELIDNRRENQIENNKIIEIKKEKLKLENENEKLNETIRSLKKKQNEFDVKQKTLDSKLQEKEVSLEKEKKNYQKLKKKYDEMKNEEKVFNSLMEENNKLKRMNEILKKKLDMYDEKRREKKIIFIGEKKEWIVDELKGYRLDFLNIDEFRKENISEEIDIWFIANETTLPNQKKIRSTDNKNIKQFDTIIELKKYIKEDLLNV